MGWLDTIRTLLGFDSDDRGENHSTVAITVEREPDAASERAVKDPEFEGDETAVDEEGETEAEKTGADEEPDQEGESEPDDSGGVTLTDIQGIGSAYADRLENAGIADVDTLAAADPENLAERADISEKRIQRWIDRATER